MVASTCLIAFFQCAHTLKLQAIYRSTDDNIDPIVGLFIAVLSPSCTTRRGTYFLEYRKQGKSVTTSITSRTG